MSRNLWHELDLRTPNALGYPTENDLCALCMVDKKSNREYYRIGFFIRDGKKLWWRDGAGGTMDPTEMRRRCHVRWTYIEPPVEIGK